MKPIINVLDKITINKVAAGEVIERPSFVIKELVENSIDAGAKTITVSIKEGGIKLIKIIDNGIGIPHDQVVKAFTRNATSKISSLEDILISDYYGFRGEALASIAAVSNLEMVTRWEEEDTGSYLEISGGKIINNKYIGANIGTSITVKDLFFNTPARLKFLKRPTIEGSYCSDIMTKLAIANPSISIKYINNDKTVFQTPGSGNLLDTIKTVYSSDIEKELIEIDYEASGVKITGFAGKASLARSDRKNQIYFINSRYIKNSPVIYSAINRAYHTLLTINKYPFTILNITIDKELVDVNVHPAKLEVRFSSDSLIFSWVNTAVKHALDLFLAKDMQISSDYNIGELNFSNSETVATSKHGDTQNVLGEKNDNVYSNLSNNTKSILNGEIIFKNSNLSSNNANEQPIYESFNNLFSNLSDNNLSSNSSLNLAEEIIVDEQNLSINEQLSMNSIKENIISFQNIKYLGQLFNTYLVIEQNNKLLLIDQHAAHERLNYEKLFDKLNNNSLNSQMLIKPEILDLDAEEYELVFSNIELINTLAFEVEEFGGTTIAIRAIPNLVVVYNTKDLFLEVLNTLKTSNINNIYELKKESIALMACKMSIKANKILSNMEVENLINDIKTLDKPTCPHGRPLIVELSKTEIEKMFKRIQ